jgi:AraC-like DNA-binding protein
MSFTYEDRSSDSSYVQTIWHTWTENRGCYVASADGSWDILISRRGKTGSVLVCGPTTKAAPVYYEEDTECIGIQFKLGTCMPQLPTHALVDTGTLLPEATGKSFWLGGSTWEFPDYENVDTFVARLVHADLLVQDPIVEAVMQGQDAYLSPRSVQRRFQHTTGLTQKYIRYIDRARQAALLLEQGLSIQDTVIQAGYVDQAHLTRSLKHLIGQTPAQIVGKRP